MANQEACPICNDPLDDKAVTVTVGEVRHRVCCEECAKEAVANPAKLRAVAPLARGR